MILNKKMSTALLQASLKGLTQQLLTSTKAIFFAASVKGN